MALATELGRRQEVLLRAGPIRYCERGRGDPLLFLHPMVVNGDLWRRVVPLLADRFRCLAPDLPLGGHETPMSPAADLSPPGVASIVAEFMEALDLEGVTLVGNDTGGALAQIVATEHPQRLARLVLVTCDAFDNFPPAAAKPLVWFAQLPGAARLAALLLRSDRVRRSPLAYGGLTKRPFEARIARSYVEGPAHDPRLLHDARKALRGLAPRHTLRAAKKLPHFERPALIVWAPEDRFFPLEHAYRLAELLPDARVEEVPDSYTFMPEDRPERLAELIAEFAAR